MVQMNLFTKQKLSHRCRKQTYGTSLAVQQLRLCTSTAGGAGSIPGGGTKFLLAAQRDQKKKEKENKLMVTKGERGAGVNWEIGIDIYGLLYTQ